MESSEFSQNCRLPFLKQEAHICFPVYEQLQTNAALLFFLYCRLLRVKLEL